MKVQLGVSGVTPAEVLAVARGNAEVEITEDALE